MDRMLNDCVGTATRYFRIDGDLSGCKDEMDDASEHNIRDLKRLAGQFIDTRRETECRRRLAEPQGGCRSSSAAA